MQSSVLPTTTPVVAAEKRRKKTGTKTVKKVVKKIVRQKKSKLPSEQNLSTSSSKEVSKEVSKETRPPTSVCETSGAPANSGEKKVKRKKAKKEGVAAVPSEPSTDTPSPDQDVDVPIVSLSDSDAQFAVAAPTVQNAVADYIAVAESVVKSAEDLCKTRKKRITSEELRLDFDALIATITTDLKLPRSERTALARSIRKLRNLSVKNFKKTSVRKPSGIMIPVNISEELSNFIGRDPSEKISRIDVNALVTKYIKSNNLQDPKDGRTILPDKKLKSLLRCTEQDTVTFFNMQKFMQPHFHKTAA